MVVRRATIEDWQEDAEAAAEAAPAAAAAAVSGATLQAESRAVDVFVCCNVLQVVLRFSV